MNHGLGVVAHVYNPITWEVETGDHQVETSMKYSGTREGVAEYRAQSQNVCLEHTRF